MRQHVSSWIIVLATIGATAACTDDGAAPPSATSGAGATSGGGGNTTSAGGGAGQGGEATGASGGQAGAPTYVSPYDDLNQRYISVAGAGVQDGSSPANAWSFDTQVATVLSSLLNPGDCLNWAPDTYDWSAALGGTALGHNNDGAGPNLPQRIVHRPVPGSAPYSVVFDAGGQSGVLGNGMDYWTWDGEEAPFDFINVAGTFFIIANSLGVPGNGAARFLQVKNFRADMSGNTAGGGNAGFFRDNRSDEVEVENFYITLSAASVHDNTACMLLDRPHAWKLRNGECVVATGNGNGRSLYYKHGDNSPTADVANSYDYRLERLFLHGDKWTDTAGFTFGRDIVETSFWENADGGDTNDNWHRYAHITATPVRWRAGTIGTDAWDGAHRWKMRYSAVPGAWEWFFGTEVPDIRGSVFSQDVTYGANAYDLAAMQSAPMSTCDDCIQGPITFAGSDPDVLADWAIVSGNGYQAGPTGRSFGADVTKVGVVSAAMAKPTVYEPYFASPLNQRSDSDFYDGQLTFDVGAHIRHGEGCARAAWGSGQGAAPSFYLNNYHRHLFAPSGNMTVEFEIWTSTGFSNGTELLYFKTTAEGTRDALDENFTLYLGPRQPTVGAGSPGYLAVDLRRSDASWSSYRRNDAANLVSETGVNVYDGNRHLVRAHFLANSVGQANGILEVWVDNLLTIARTDVEYFTTSGQLFNQVIVGPALRDGNAPQAQELYWADLRLFNRDW
jgi:hypothetical protein